MNKLFFALAAIAMFSAGYMMMNKESNLEVNQHMELSKLFNAWKAEHNKMYTSMEEEMFRFKVFVETKRWVDANNGGEVEYALNQFSDLTKEEFVSTYLGYVHKPEEMEEAEEVEQLEANPTSVNWTQQGDVSPIQNQGQCGSCWSFSAAQAVESLYAIQKGQNNPVPVLSEEQLVQCSKLYLNFGCNGGQMTQAFKYVKDHPLATNAQYPYTSGNGVTGSCNKSLEKEGTYGIGGYKTVAANCGALETAVAQQPVSVAVDASNWSSYKSGIMTQCGTALNHGVLAVGYQQGSYWLVKNSWGTSWGQSGYIQVGYNNACGICNSASYPTF